MRLGTLVFLILSCAVIERQSFSDPVLVGGTEGLTESQIESPAAPVRDWEARRDALLESGDGATVEFALDVVRTGVAMRVSGRASPPLPVKASPYPA